MTGMRRTHGVQGGGARRTILVADVMSRDMVVMPAWFSAVNVPMARGGRHAAYPVIDASGMPVGVVGPDALTADDLAGRTLGEICRPLSCLPVVRPDDDIDRLRALLEVAAGVGVLVIQDDRLVGMISPGYLIRLARARAVLAN